MIFRYGYQEAALRFSGLIKSSLDQSMRVLKAGEVEKHEQLIQKIVIQTEQWLKLHNETFNLKMFS